MQTCPSSRLCPESNTTRSQELKIFTASCILAHYLLIRTVSVLQVHTHCCRHLLCTFFRSDVFFPQLLSGNWWCMLKSHPTAPGSILCILQTLRIIHECTVCMHHRQSTQNSKLLDARESIFIFVENTLHVSSDKILPPKNVLVSTYIRIWSLRVLLKETHELPFLVRWPQVPGCSLDLSSQLPGWKLVHLLAAPAVSIKPP